MELIDASVLYLESEIISNALFIKSSTTVQVSIYRSGFKILLQKTPEGEKPKNWNNPNKCEKTRSLKVKGV